jgi:hypothetical protein
MLGFTSKEATMPEKGKFDTSNWYRMDTNRFINVWKTAVRGDKDFGDFISMLQDEFDSDTGTDSAGKKWSNKSKSIKDGSVEAKCRSINKQFAKSGRRLPVPGKSADVDYQGHIEEDDDIFSKVPTK